MNIKIFIVGALVLLVGYGVFTLSTSDNGNSNSESIETNETSETVETNEANDTEVSSSAELSGTGTLEDLMRDGGNYRCEFSSESTSDGVTQTQEGLIYSSGDRMRVDTSMSSDVAITPDGSTSMEASMIMMDDVVYNWSDYGAMRMDVSDFEGDGGTSGATASDGGPMDLYEQDFQYECDSWSVDESVFALPAGVEFMDMNEMMENMMNGMDIPEELYVQ